MNPKVCLYLYPAIGHQQLCLPVRTNWRQGPSTLTSYRLAVNGTAMADTSSMIQVLAVGGSYLVNQPFSVEGLLQALMSLFGWSPVVLRERRVPRPCVSCQQPRVS